ncbi:LpxI family protein [Aureimonas sp. AU40]|uniref:LpxI family protein n=1 Tax=Aureimonas sp. AU40 TaxID=1637747 RepID=UPI001FCCD398|nr:UDP-2,3-diacylglucosamine diphosphatase LpxI [Aureimonas sp. AU40]
MSANAALTPMRPGERLGIIAGGGTLPAIIAHEAERLGWRPFIVAIADGRDSSWDEWESVSLTWGQTGNVFAHLRRRGVSKLVFSGTISVRPDYRSILPSLQTLRMLPEILRMTRGGDDSLIRAVAGTFERRGFEVVSVQAISPTLLLPAGNLTNRPLSERHHEAIHRAQRAATRLGLLDIGQAVVASADRVIALEGIEGTKEMLLRVADLRGRGRIGASEPCVLFKAFKPQQDARFDLPSIGTETIRQAQEAGLAGIAMSANRSLVIEPQRVAEEAEAAGLFVLGIETALGEDPS